MTLYRAHSVTRLIIFSQNPGYISWHLLRLYQCRDSDSVLFICTAAQIFSCCHMYHCFLALHLLSCGNFSFPFGTSVPCLASENLHLSSYCCKLLQFFSSFQVILTTIKLQPTYGPQPRSLLVPQYIDLK